MDQNMIGVLHHPGQHGNIPMTGHYMYDGSGQHQADNSVRDFQPSSNMAHASQQQGYQFGFQMNQSVGQPPGVMHFQNENAVHQSFKFGRQQNQNADPQLQMQLQMQHGQMPGYQFGFPSLQHNQNVDVQQNQNVNPLSQPNHVSHQQYHSDPTAPPGSFAQANHQQLQNLLSLTESQDSQPMDLFSLAIRGGTTCGTTKNAEWNNDIAQHDFGPVHPVGPVQPVGLVNGSAFGDGSSLLQPGLQPGPVVRNKQAAENSQKKTRGKRMPQAHVDEEEVREDWNVQAPPPHPQSDFQNSAMMDCQCHLKMLMPNHIAGAIIGREGVQIGEILLITRCQMQISACDDFFPGTWDRILIMGGSMRGLEECIRMVLRHFREVTNPDKKGREERAFLCKLAVPSSAVSGLIGHQGDKVKRLSEQTGCRVNMSPRVDGMQERIVLIYGDFESLMEATIFIARDIQSDPHLKEHLALKYDVKIPLGAWSGEKAAPAQPNEPLIPPEDAPFYSKRELILYLQNAAPREILLRHCLLGKIENTMKSKGTADLKPALQETWDLRMEFGIESVTVREKPDNPHPQHPVVVTEVAMPLPPGEVKRSQMTATQASSFPIPAVKQRQRSITPPKINAPQPATIATSDTPSSDRGRLSSRGGANSRKSSAVRASSRSNGLSQDRHGANGRANKDVVELTFHDITLRDCDNFERQPTDESERVNLVEYMKPSGTPSPKASTLPMESMDGLGPGKKRTRSRARSLSTHRTDNGSSRREHSAQGRLGDSKKVQQVKQLDQPRKSEMKLRARLGGTLQGNSFDEVDEFRFNLEEDEQLADRTLYVFPDAEDLQSDEGVGLEIALMAPIEDELEPDVPISKEATICRVRHALDPLAELSQMVLTGASNMTSYVMPLKESLADSLAGALAETQASPLLGARITLQIFTSGRLAANLAADIARPRPPPIECDQPEAEPPVPSWPTPHMRIQASQPQRSFEDTSVSSDDEGYDDGSKSAHGFNPIQDMARSLSPMLPEFDVVPAHEDVTFSEHRGNSSALAMARVERRIAPRVDSDASLTSPGLFSIMHEWIVSAFSATSFAQDETIEADPCPGVANVRVGRFCGTCGGLFRTEAAIGFRDTESESSDDVVDL